MCITGSSLTPIYPGSEIMSAEYLQPDGVEELADIVRWASSSVVPLEVQGKGSKKALGRSVNADHIVSVGSIGGIVDYAPDELVLTVRAGTALEEIQAALAESEQRLAFDPADLGMLLGGVEGIQTIGGVLACNISGSRRMSAGAARDHFLGFQAVNGSGQLFRAGGRVVKNVTGYDLMKLMAGSYGTLSVLTEVTVKVLPRPKEEATLILSGVDGDIAADLIANVRASACEAVAAAILPQYIIPELRAYDIPNAGGLSCVFLLEGFGPSVRSRTVALTQMLTAHGSVAQVDAEASAMLWRHIRDVIPFANSPGAVWRISVAPNRGIALGNALALRLGGKYYCDWAGGLIWLNLPRAADNAGAGIVREAVAAAGGGHATLIRAGEAEKQSVPVFEPLPTPLSVLAREVKKGFDPLGILNPGRMYADIPEVSA